MPSVSFRVMWPHTPQKVAQYKELGCPHDVPWSLVAPHEARAQKNHRQTLEELQRRGGLDVVELVAVLDDKPLRWIFSSPAATAEKCIARLKVLLAKHDDKE